jgi:polysaccharide deacetylase family protein (PEP-CTERM system associated)
MSDFLKQYPGMCVSTSKAQPNCKPVSSLTIDVEDWFHILDSSAVPSIEKWPSLESRVEKNVEKILEILNSFSVKATFFWLGWIAERYPYLVKKCHKQGHEIASHGYAHVMAYQVGRKVFAEDICRGKAILEDIMNQKVRGFRTAGFGIKNETLWVFDQIQAAGFIYDSSVFPAHRGHGGMPNSPLGLYIIDTQNGPLIEVSTSAIEILGHRLSLFGGGYLRISPKWVIRWGIDRLYASGQPLVVYLHPREIDPNHPRLPLSFVRRFKCYVNLKSTIPKIRWLCENFKFVPMRDLVQEFLKRRNISFVKYD